jgi:tape measure domain-containing protein
MAAPQLRLEVSLNLAGFRNEVRKLTQIAQSEFNPLLKVNVDTKDYRAQLKALERIKPVIKIEDRQIDAARARIGTLHKSLATLRRATSTPIEIKLKYTEIGKPPSTAAGQIDRAVSGGVRGSQALEGASRSELLNIRKMMSEAGMALGKITSLSKATASELRNSIIPAFTNSGEEAVNGLAAGLKDSSSKIGTIAAKVGVEAVNGIKGALGIASPSRVFKQIGEFSIDGLEIGFLNGLKDFKSKSVAEIRKIVALMQFELAKVSGVSMAPGMSRSAGSRGSRQYMSPIGPLPEGSKEPWAFSQYRYQPFMAQPGQTRGAGVPPMRERFPFAAAPSVMGTTTSPSMFGASFPALPSAGMTGGNAVRQAQLQSRMAAAYARSAAREASVLGESQMNARVSGQVPLGDPTPRLPAGNRGGALALRDAGAQTPLSLDYYKNAVKYSEALKVANASTRNFSASQIPLIGGIKNLAGEFGQAAKQVLLYGTAYKGLAFLTSLPGQILNAAKSQQQFTNGLKVATQDTGTFAKELLYVDNVQRAFGLNLETTRTGFTRLYASMAPTGFDSGSIEKLFTGISAATASLQLTPDKAERVIYAFGQMASKGQIMSEELKGQLGDVLPGALAIFSKAAGMSVKEFSKAMEDGEFVGTRFREVFAKVSDELMNRFGTGAQVAGRSLQGLINTVGGDFQRTLESFAPLANAAAQATLGPLTGMLREVSMAAQIAMGEQDRVRKQLEAAQADVATLQMGGADAKEIKAAEQNVAALAARYEVLNEAVKDPAIAQQVKNIEAFVSEMQKAATFTMNLAGVIGSVLNPLFTFLGGNLTSVIGNLALLVLGFNAAKLAAMLMMGVLNTMTAISGITATGAASTTVLAGAFRLLGVQATGAQVATIGFGVAIKGLLISTGIGAVIVLLGSLAAAFLSVGNKAKEAADRAKRSIDSMADAARTGNVSLIEMELSVNKADRQDLEGLIKNVEELKGTKGARGVELVTLTPEMKREAKRLGVEVAGEVSRGSVLGSLKGLRAPLAKVVNEGSKDLEDARKRAESLGMNKPTPGATPPETPGDGTGKPSKEQSLESYYGLQDQLAKNFTQDQLDRMEQEYQARVNRINSEFDLREARANSFQKEAIRFERQISDIELKRQKALLDASAEVIKAQGSVAGGAGGQSTTGATGLLQGSTGISSGAHFDVRRQDGSYISPEQAKALFDPSVRRQLAMTSAYGPRRAPVPGASTFHKGVDLAGPANTPLNLAPGFAMTGSGEKGGLGYAASVRGPSGEMYDVGHLQRPTAGMGTPRKVTGDEKRDVIADQKAQLAVAQQSLTVRIADAQAVRDAAVAWAQYSASIVPVEEQALQNDILAKKNELVRVGMPEDVIEKELKYFEAQQKTTLAIANNNELFKNGLIDEKQHAKNLSELQTRLAGYNTELDRNIQLQRQQSFDASMGALQKQITMATPVGGTGLAAGFMGDAGAKYEEAIKEGRSQDEAARFAELQNQLTLLETRNGAVKSSVLAIGDAFATAMTTGVAGLISGTATAQEVFASFLKSVGDALSQAAQQMIATYIAIGIAKIFAGLDGGGNFTGGTSSAVPTDAAGWGSSFQTSLPGLSGDIGRTPIGFANGGIATGGFTAFANGGMVTGPTMGLVGEGKYNEAIVPLPDGKSIPVQMTGSSGGGSLRDAMNSNSVTNSSPVLNMSFQSTSINGVEYVSRDQLESAMAETRRNATRDGAKRGMTMTLDRIQNSSSTRRKVGI